MIITVPRHDPSRRYHSILMGHWYPAHPETDIPSRYKILQWNSVYLYPCNMQLQRRLQNTLREETYAEKRQAINFLSQTMEEFARVFIIPKYCTSAYHPQSNRKSLECSIIQSLQGQPFNPNERGRHCRGIHPRGACPWRTGILKKNNNEKSRKREKEENYINTETLTQEIESRHINAAAVAEQIIPLLRLSKN